MIQVCTIAPVFRLLLLTVAMTTMGAPSITLAPRHIS
jgi:hypothetical protein